jgi:hypothetical protein
LSLELTLNGGALAARYRYGLGDMRPSVGQNPKRPGRNVRNPSVNSPLHPPTPPLVSFPTQHWLASSVKVRTPTTATA